MITNTGYRNMLRDRLPKVVNFALKWCKVKEAWIDHAYKSWIWVFSDKKLRLSMTREILGIDKTRRQFIFEDTIDWENLSEEETSKWENVTGWVSWFQKKYAYIENAYILSKQQGKSLLEIKYEIMNSYLTSMFPTKQDTQEQKEQKNKKINELLDFLIDCFEDRIK